MRLNPFRRKKKQSYRRSSVEAESWLSPQARRAVFGIIVLVFSLIAILSFFDAAGPTGTLVLGFLRRVFGWFAYLVPMILVAWALHLVWPRRFELGRLRVVGVLLTTVGLLGFFHIVGASADDALQAAHEGRAGGYLGFLLSFPLSQAVSRAAAALIFLGSFFIGMILTFRISPADVWGWLRQAFRSDRKEDEIEEEEEDFEQESAGPRFRMKAVRGIEQPEMETSGLSLSQHEEGSRLTQQLLSGGRRYRPAVLKLLQSAGRVGTRNRDLEKQTKETIRRTLEHFGIQVEMGEANVGPTVTQYTLRPEEGTKLTRITALQNDLALALAAHPIRIEAPIPNKDLVGIEIPNKTPSLVRLRDLLMSREFREAESPLAFPLGRDVSGQVVVDTLERLPHLLIAGATGSGKSVNIHTLLVSWLYRNSPDVVRFIMVDPKRVELPVYNNIPHLLSPVIVDVEKTVHALKWAIEEMDVRYRLLEESGARNLLSFNLSNPTEARPFIVIVIDELADLMVRHGREVEGPIVRLSQLARAVGIHLVLATQRPSVNVLTGLIKANVPSRIAFSVASQVDSRTIIDMAGAEKLVGNGDMLYLSGDKARPIRIQGGFVSEEEVRRVVKEVQKAGEPDYNEAVTAQVCEGDVLTSGRGDDPLLGEAQRLVVLAGKASASLLQRRLRVGYARAARLLDMLEEQGVIGCAEGNKPRPVLQEAPLQSEMRDEHEEEDEKAKW
ncbi:MAG: DNA translocase FtsK 4TM domain-containing protein [bacterium]